MATVMHPSWRRALPASPFLPKRKNFRHSSFWGDWINFLILRNHYLSHSLYFIKRWVILLETAVCTCPDFPIQWGLEKAPKQCVQPSLPPRARRHNKGEKAHSMGGNRPGHSRQLQLVWTQGCRSVLHVRLPRPLSQLFNHTLIWVFLLRYFVDVVKVFK